MTLRKGSHSVSELVYHFTFVPEYRRRKLIGNIKERLAGMIKFCAQVNGWKILELNIQVDHVRLVLETNTNESPALVMQLVKGVTSKKLREIFPGLVESIWSKSFWSEGYYVGTAGTRDLSEIRRYVREQRHDGEENNQP